jgi:DMSO/TMAO reductase YedYZ heme-binding membrane subunit
MKDPRFAKLVVFVNSAVPLSLVMWDAFNQRLGANPSKFALNTTGMLALVFLLLSLTVTPIRLITGWNWLSHFRRMLGLYAFVYAGLHLLTYFIFDRSLSVSSTVEDVFKRRFIFFGMTAFVLMIPLAITSTNGMIKRLGAAKWKRLHQLVYASAILGVVHFYMRVKADVLLPVTFGFVLAVLLLYRLLVPHLSFLKRGRKPVAAAR